MASKTPQPLESQLALLSYYLSARLQTWAMCNASTLDTTCCANSLLQSAANRPSTLAALLGIEPLSACLTCQHTCKHHLPQDQTARLHQQQQQHTCTFILLLQDSTLTAP